MNLHELIPILESIAPPELAEGLDKGRIGLVLDRGAGINKIAVALDPTDYVLKPMFVRFNIKTLSVEHMSFNPLQSVPNTLNFPTSHLLCALV